jgi:hypothetical protein
LAVDRSAQLIQDSKTFRGWLIGALAGMVLPSSHAIADRGVSPEKIADPLTLYGNEIHFDVYREGDKVGFHSVGFETDGRNLFVRSSFRVEIDVLFFTAYRYLYQSEAKWVEGKLETLKASVDDDGSAFSLSAVRQGKRMNITSTDGGFSADAPLIPTNHWNANVLGQTRVLNTLTGEVNDVRPSTRAGCDGTRPRDGNALCLYRRLEHRGLVRRPGPLGEDAVPRSGRIGHRVCLPPLPGLRPQESTTVSVGGDRSRVAWITGAGKGIGRALTKRLAENGWTVAASARTQEDLSSLEAEYPKGRVHGFALDVTDVFSTQATVNAIEARLGELSLVVLNAGTHIPMPAEEFSVENFRVLVETNLMGTVNTLDQVIPKFIDRKRGHIAVVASLAGYRGQHVRSAKAGTGASRRAPNPDQPGFRRNAAHRQE